MYTHMFFGLLKYASLEMKAREKVNLILRFSIHYLVDSQILNNRWI